MPKPIKKASPKQISAYAPQLGSHNAQMSGTAHIDNLTDKQLREIAMKAAKARWQKRSARP
jgi:hypothetical protein